MPVDSRGTVLRPIRANDWVVGFENEVVRSTGRRIKRHKSGITRQMMKVLLAVFDHALFGQTRLLLVIKTAMMSAFAE